METNTAPVTTEAAPTETQTEAPVETQTPAQTALKKKYKLQVDGEEFEEEVDLSDEEGLKKKFQLAAAAKKRMSEASTIKAQALQLINSFKNGDMSILKSHPKGREIAEAFLLSQIEDEMLTQEQKDQRAREAKLKSYEEREAKEEEAKKSQAQLQRENEIAQDFQKTIIEAIGKAGLPKSHELVRRMAGLLQKNLKLGLDLTPDELAQEVKNETTATLKSILKNATGAQLIEMFGPELAKQIRKHDIEVLKGKQAGGTTSRTPAADIPKPEKGYLTTDEWKAELEKRIKS